MERSTFLSPERKWTQDELDRAQYCIDCLKKRPERAAVQCAAQVDLGNYTQHARISCAGIMRAGDRMPEHGRMSPERLG